MLIGVPKEIKNRENRVGLTPESVQELVAAGHQVVMETNAGQGINASDDDYVAAGASIAATAADSAHIPHWAHLCMAPRSHLRLQLQQFHCGRGFLLLTESVVQKRIFYPLEIPTSQLSQFRFHPTAITTTSSSSTIGYSK